MSPSSSLTAIRGRAPKPSGPERRAMDPTNGYSGGYQNPGGGIAPPRSYALSGKIMLSVMVALFTVVLLILFLHLYVRWHLLRLASRRARRRRGRRRGLLFVVDGQGPSVARGLDPDALKSLPVLVYSTGAGDLVECAVCLSEFEEGEKVRNLPRCGHRFHIECVDMWFQSHATCPLCRAAVEQEKGAASAADSVRVQVADTPSPPPLAAVDLCTPCRSEDGTGSSSSTNGGVELRIAVPARRGLEEELGFSPGLKSPGGRIQAIRRMLSRDLRLCRSEGSVDETDLERGEGPPPPPPLPPPVQQDDTRREIGRTRSIDG